MCECVCVLAKEGDGDEEEEEKKTGTRTHLSAQRTKSLPFHSDSQGTGARDNSLVAVFFFWGGGKEWGCTSVNKNSTHKRGLVLLKNLIFTQKLLMPELNMGR